jgi:hypothetical protein
MLKAGYLSEQSDARRLASGDHIVRPYGRLDLADVGFAEQCHADAALSDAAAYRVRKATFEQRAVEGKISSLLTPGDL